MSNSSNKNNDLVFSIIIPTFNNISLLTNCIESVQKNTSNHEIIIVDNGSPDFAFNYITSFISRFDNIEYFHFDKNRGFAEAINKGLTIAKGHYLILLNDDVIVSKDWATTMLKTLNTAYVESDFSDIIAVGPVSNAVGGPQSLIPDDYSLENFEEVSEKIREDHKDKYDFVNFLSGFCLLIENDIYREEKLLDEDFVYGGYEDNDLCHRLTLDGYKMIIDRSVFIHHFGEVTMNKLPDFKDTAYLSNNIYYVDKYSDEHNNKLGVISRIGSAPDYIDKFLDSVENYADGLLVVLDNPDKYTKQKVLDFDLLTDHLIFDKEHNESRDRQKLLDMAYEHSFDWAISLDVDETVDDRLTREKFGELMNPVNPDILYYTFQILTFYNKNNDFMLHSVWGNMFQARMFRIFPDQKVVISDKTTLHCSHSPHISPVNTARTSFKILHYGYDSVEKRTSKYDHYTEIDPEPDKFLVGPEGYDHLVSQEVSLAKYFSNNSITLGMLYNGEFEDAWRMLYSHYFLFDNIIILSTADDKFIEHIANSFDAELYFTEWSDSFSDLRNELKSYCDSKWLMFLDPDEYIDPAEFMRFTKLHFQKADGFLFLVYNYQPDGTVLLSDNARFLRNTDDVYYTHRVHETITESFEKNDLILRPSNITIHHKGFLISDEHKQKKSELYTDLLRKEIEEKPDIPINYFHLAFHYFENDNEDKGIQLLKKTLNIDPDSFLASKELGLKYLDYSLHYLEKSLNSMSDRHYYYNWLEDVFKKLEEANKVQYDG